MRIEGNTGQQGQVRLGGHRADQRGDVPWGQDGQKTHVGKPHRIRQTESQSDQSKTVLHDKQDIEVTSEQSDNEKTCGVGRRDSDGRQEDPSNQRMASTEG